MSNPRMKQLLIDAGICGKSRKARQYDASYKVIQEQKKDIELSQRVARIEASAARVNPIVAVSVINGSVGISSTYAVRMRDMGEQLVKVIVKAAGHRRRVETARKVVTMKQASATAW